MNKLKELKNRLEELKSGEDWDNRREYVRLSREYARLIESWGGLKNDEDLDNCNVAEYYLLLLNEK